MKKPTLVTRVALLALALPLSAGLFACERRQNQMGGDAGTESSRGSSMNQQPGAMATSTPGTSGSYNSGSSSGSSSSR